MGGEDVFHADRDLGIGAVGHGGRHIRADDSCVLSKPYMRSQCHVPSASRGNGWRGRRRTSSGALSSAPSAGRGVSDTICTYTLFRGRKREWSLRGVSLGWDWVNHCSWHTK